MLQQIIKEKLVETISKNVGVKQIHFEDFVQEIYLILLEYNQNKLKEIYENNQLKFFLTRIIINQYHSKTSPFYKKYRKYYELIDGNIGNFDAIDDEEHKDKRTD